jgi:CRP/FNR family transcriptional regulator, polysaccharide utilization system transcription regulator
MNQSAYTLINLIRKDLEESNRIIDDDQLFIFRNPEGIKRVKFKKGTIIVNEGDDFNYIFFLAKGLLKVFRDVDDKRVFVRILAPGEYLGLNLFSKIKKYPYSLVALGDSVVYLISKEIFSENVYSNPQIMKWVIDNLSGTISGLYRKIINLSSKHMNGRIAEAILYFADDIFMNDEFELPVSRKQLGHFTNISPENVTRILMSFTEEKILELDGKKLRILNKETLEMISKTG